MGYLSTTVRLPPVTYRLPRASSAVAPKPQKTNPSVRPQALPLLPGFGEASIRRRLSSCSSELRSGWLRFWRLPLVCSLRSAGAPIAWSFRRAFRSYISGRGPGGPGNWGSRLFLGNPSTSGLLPLCVRTGKPLRRMRWKRRHPR